MTPPAHPQFFPSIGRFLTPGGWPSDYLVIDIETDGFGPKTIPLQVAWLQIRDRKPVPSESGSRILDWTRLGYPYEVDYLAERIAKTAANMAEKGLSYRFTIEGLIRDGIDPKAGLEEMNQAITLGGYIVGYNHLFFDLPILGRHIPHLIVMIDRQLDLGLIEKARQHDMVPRHGDIDQWWYKSVRDAYSRSKWNLDQARIAYGLDCDPAKSHDAGQDCYDTHLLLEAMRPLVNP